jgi:GNAT superfamily N-acetyltransferase
MLNLVKELAIYERAPEQVIVDAQAMETYWDQGLFQAHVADEDSTIIGIAIYYTAYSTWKGKIVYLDDLIVTESKRRSGAGRLLFDAVMSHCREIDANQLRWHVLEWNEPAIRFYQKIGATLDPEWITGKLERASLDRTRV